MQPESVTLLPWGSQQFIDPNATTWIISPNLGSINPNTGFYTAPGTLWLSRTLTVTALRADGTEISHGTISISSARAWMTLLGIFWILLSIVLLWGVLAIWPPPARPASVAVYPVVASLQNGETLQFLSSSNGTGDVAVNWSASDGDITPSGVFSAPTAPKAGPITVTATRNSDHSQTASAQVIISAAHLVMDHSVVDASNMNSGDKVPFRGLGAGGPQSRLKWYLSGPGEVDPNDGTYTLRGKTASQSIVTAIDPTNGRKAAAVVQLSSSGVVSDLPMLLLIVLMGAFGAMIAAIRSFVNFVGSRSFVPSWSFYYLFRPLFGAGLALIVFFGYRIGAVTGPSGGSPADPFTAAFVAGMVGLFADTVLQKLKETVEQIFRPQDTRSDKLPVPGEASAAAPAISKLTLDQGVLTVTGTGFTAGVVVSLNGTPTPAALVDSTKLTVALPAGLAAGTKLDVFVTNNDGKKSSTSTVTT